MKENHLIEWLLGGDVSIQYQVYRDLFGSKNLQLRTRVSTEGWGAVLLPYRKEDGHWGRGF